MPAITLKPLKSLKTNTRRYLFTLLFVPAMLAALGAGASAMTALAGTPGAASASGAGLGAAPRSPSASGSTCSSISLAAAQNYPMDTQPVYVAVGDFNGDGNQDLVSASSVSNTLSVLLGTGSDSFLTATTFLAGGSPNSVVVGDFNGDGKQDLAAANGFPSGAPVGDSVSILLGDGAGSFGAPGIFLTTGGLTPVSVAVGDFNGDGKQDLVTANNG